MAHHFYFADVAELADALESGSSVRWTWGFESLHPHHIIFFAVVAERQTRQVEGLVGE